VSIQKSVISLKVNEGEDFNRRNTDAYFEDENLSLTQRLGERAISGGARI
jgi:hypothetical protein